MKERPKIATGVYIFNNKGEVLLTRSHKWNNMWCVPGGKLEHGELLVDCVRREVKEETNLEIKDIEKIDMIEAPFVKEFHDDTHFLFFIYRCKWVSGDIKLNDELQEHIWVLPKDCPEDANKYVRSQMKKF